MKNFYRPARLAISRSIMLAAIQTGGLTTIGSNFPGTNAKLLR